MTSTRMANHCPHILLTRDLAAQKHHPAEIFNFWRPFHFYQRKMDRPPLVLWADLPAQIPWIPPSSIPIWLVHTYPPFPFLRSCFSSSAISRLYKPKMSIQGQKGGRREWIVSSKCNFSHISTNDDHRQICTLTRHKDSLQIGIRFLWHFVYSLVRFRSFFYEAT